MKKWLIVAIVLIALIVGVVGFVYTNYFYLPTGTWTPIELTKENLPANLQRFSAVADMPEGSEVQLYVDEVPYIISKDHVDLGETNNADLSVKIPGKYLEIMGEKGWCAGLQEARKNNDLNVEIKGDEKDLLWKYKTLLRYRDCIG